MSVRTRRVEHRDRGLAIAHHAVERVRLRAPGVRHLDDERVRLLVADAVAHGKHEPHYVEGQTRVLGHFLGVDLYIVLAKDMTGWGRGGVAVATVLTPEQIATSEAHRPRLVAT